MSIDRESRLEQPSLTTLPISKSVLNRTLKDYSLPERLEEDVNYKDIAYSTGDDIVATQMVRYSAAIHTDAFAHNVDEYPALETMYHRGSLLMCHIRNTQYYEKEKLIKPLSKQQLYGYIYDLIPPHIDFQKATNQEILVYNQSLGDMLSGLEDSWSHTLLSAQTKTSIIESYRKKYQLRKKEFIQREKSLTLNKYSSLSSYSENEREAFFAGLVNTYYLFKTGNEQEDLRALWGDS